MRSIWTNERREGESFKDYRGRLKVMAKVAKVKARGDLAHVSAQVGIIADKDWRQEHTDAVLKGQPVRMGTTVANGKTLHLVRDKGTTYRRPVPKAPSKRDQWRARRAA